MSNAFDASLLGKIASYTEILAKDPRSTVFVSLADAYRRMGLLEDALEVTQQGVKSLPRFCPGQVMLGRLLFESGDLDGALDSLQTAYDLDGGSLSAIRGLARVLSAKGEKDRARELLESAARQFPQEAGIAKMLASLPPLDPVDSVSADGAEEPIATPTIAEIYLKQGFPERALKVYRDLLKVHPGNQALRIKLADLEQMLGLGPKPGIPEAGSALGTSMADLPSPPETVASVSGLTEAPPGSVDTRLVLLDRWLTAIHRRREHVR